MMMCNPDRYLITSTAWIYVRALVRGKLTVDQLEKWASLGDNDATDALLVWRRTS